MESHVCCPCQRNERRVPGVYVPTTHAVPSDLDTGDEMCENILAVMRNPYARSKLMKTPSKSQRKRHRHLLKFNECIRKLQRVYNEFVDDEFAMESLFDSDGEEE